ncbi:MAG TPA: aminodeoxychorismate synthase component I [Firmicutes bacterium]|nr:aminodeoxychorismate synthase component I [Bacillota bacterium]
MRTSTWYWFFYTASARRCSNLIVMEVPGRDPVRVFEAFRKRPYSIFLDSGMDPGRLGRYSLIGSDPFLVFKSKGREVTVFENSNWRIIKGHPFKILKGLLKRYRAGNDPRIPVAAGAFGYFAYDLNRQIERLPQIAVDDLGLPDCYLGFYDCLTIYDHQQSKMFLTSTGLPEHGKRADVRARERLQGLVKYVCADAENKSVLPAGYPDDDSGQKKGKAGEEPVIYGHFTYESYCAAVQKVKDYISAGDILQAILSQRFSCRLPKRPWQLYLHLRNINPAPFAAYLHYPELDIICASPERFLKVDGCCVETRPIKGTRPRGKNSLEDLRLRAELLQSEKDRAELSMITELERSDLERVCCDGSVEVQEWFGLEEYPTVFHLVSTVRGQLAPEKDLIDLLLAAFPGGSITGTPKIRAMEIIEELEPVKRGVYTGSIGYLGFDGNADLNVVIRTFVVKDGTAYFQVGGGIINNSEPDAEYRETITKAGALLCALGCKGEVKVCQVWPGLMGGLSTP